MLCVCVCVVIMDLDVYGATDSPRCVGEYVAMTQYVHQTRLSHSCERRESGLFVFYEETCSPVSPSTSIFTFFRLSADIIEDGAFQLEYYGAHYLEFFANETAYLQLWDMVKSTIQVHMHSSFSCKEEMEINGGRRGRQVLKAGLVGRGRSDGSSPPLHEQYPSSSGL